MSGIYLLDFTRLGVGRLARSGRNAPTDGLRGAQDMPEDRRAH